MGTRLKKEEVETLGDEILRNIALERGGMNGNYSANALMAQKELQRRSDSFHDGRPRKGNLKEAFAVIK